MSRVEHPDWTGASCRDHDPELWFPGQGEAGRAAKAICRHCALREECLEWALATDQPAGIWGGKSRNERAYIRLQRGRGAPRRETTATYRAEQVAKLTRAGAPAAGIAAQLGVDVASVYRHRRQGVPR